MLRKLLPTQDRVKELLDYNAEEGYFTWKASTNNFIKVGDNAGSVLNTGYVAISIDGISYQAHRLAWVYSYGVDPGEFVIDHKNKKRNDNRLKNLRIFESGDNNHHVEPQGKVPYLGVSIKKATGKFIAQIGYKGKTIHLGTFLTPEEAHEAYKLASLKYYG